MSKRKTHEIYVIGGNKSHELTNDANDIRELIKRKSDKRINAIYSGNGYSIFTDYDDGIWVTGQYNESHRAIIFRDQTPGSRVIIDYFKQNQISIRKICTNPSGHHTFWISDKHQLYGNGINDSYQLGLGHRNLQTTPILIDSLQNVIDAKSSPTGSFAVCSTPNTSTIIMTQYWSRMNKIDIPNEIMNIIIAYHHVNEVYCTGDAFDETINTTKEKWTKVEQFTDVDIVKLAVGYVHALFLSSDGNVWSCGNNGHGQLGDNVQFTGIQQIQYFAKNSMFIKDIECGFYNNLALTDNGKVYSWGENLFGQCGNGDSHDLYTPTLVETLKDYNIVEIGCGVAHCYAITEGNKAFLWGDNLYGECLDFESGKKKVRVPLCIDGIVKEKTNGKVMKISLGYDNTKLFVM